MAISPEVKIYIQDYKKALKKELSYVKANNWSMTPEIFSREKKEKRQRLITERNLSKLKHFIKIAEDFKDMKTVSEFINLLLEFIDIYIHRFQFCEDTYDWTTYEEEFKHLPVEDLNKKIDLEIEFQSEVLNVVNRLRIDVQKMNIDDSNKTLELPIYADVEVPFLMRHKVERMFPEVIKYINEKKE